MKIRLRFLARAGAVAVMLSAHSLFACTGFYAGKRCTEDGSVLIGRTVDLGELHAGHRVVVVPRVENAPGRVYRGVRGFAWELPATTWKYVATPRLTCEGDGEFASVAANEKGLAVSATVTGYVRTEIDKAFPAVKTGCAEENLTSVLAASCASAAEAVDLVGAIMAKCGTAERNIVMVADRREAWLIEIYTGRLWAAMRLPEDRIAAFGNNFLLGAFDPASPDWRAAPDIRSAPEAKGLAVLTGDGKLDLFHTYSGRRYQYANVRSWFAKRHLAPGTEGVYADDAEFPLVYPATRKLGVKDIFEAMRLRYEGTAWCPEETGREDVRVIGTESQSSSHVIALRDDLPSERCITVWECLGPAEHSVYLPLSNAIDWTDEAFARDRTEKRDTFLPDLACDAFRRLAALCQVNRRMYGRGVRDFWSLREKELLARWPAVFARGDAKEMTAFVTGEQRRALADAKRLHEELEWYVAENGLTRRYGHCMGVLTRMPDRRPFVPEAVRKAGDRMALWPEGRIPDFQAHQVGAMENETKAKGFVPDEHRMPYLQWYAAPTNANGACMILLSGGAYSYCCSISLVEAWRKELTALGFQCVNLAYRTPRPKGLPIWQSAWEDGQRAVRLVRSEARRRGFDPERIGVMGMSAGGHLATLLATSALTPAYARVDALDDIPCHVNLAIPHAAAYNTATNIETGAAFDPAAAGAVNSCFKFDAKTCPICFNHGGTDPYTPLGSTLCYRELRKRKVPAELHLYADRGHAAHESGRFVEFMRQLGWLGELGFQWPLDHRYHPDATARTEKEALWPTNGIPSRQADQSYEPYLVWYVPEKPTTRAIQVVFAGGGYTDCNYVGEAEPVAYYLNQKGMTTVCVKYRCPRPKDAPKHLLAWQDAQRAIRKVRSEASARGLDPNRIGAMGFSAGGHLTLMTALSSLTNAYEPVDDVDRMSCSVQWACPVYPAYALTDGVDSPNTEGGNLDRDVPVPEFAFDAATPPMCFLHGDADGYSAMASVKIWERLRAMGVQGDLHTLALQGHCFQLRAAEGTGAFTCLDRVWEFLVRKGFLRENAADGFPGRGVIAHRGDAAEYPENTPEAFRSAVAKGAAMVELDEWRCKTGELVVCHDGSVDRTTDGKGRICDLTLEQIRALDAGCRKSSRFRGTRIPTLAEALACFPKTGLLLNIHCKTGDAAPEVAELLRREGRIRQGILMCDSREALEAVRAMCPWARTGLVGDTEDGWQKRPWTDAEAWETIRYAAKVGVDFLQVLPGCHCTAEQMRFLHDRGIRTTYFMADDARTMRELVAEGHDFIFTDSYSELEPVYRQAVAR